MNQCTSCSGLVPEGIAECPHCSSGGDGNSNQISESRFSKHKPVLQRISAAASLGLIAVTISACYGVPPETCLVQDLDGDGFQQCVYDGPEPARPWYNNYYPSVGYDINDLSLNDCDDSDPNINPLADDPINDGIDQNCDRADGVFSEAGAELISPTHYCDSPYTKDNDGDGYSTCRGPVPDWAKQTIIADGAQGDCNDYSSSINPGEEDLSVDGIDQNCNTDDGS